MKGRAARRAAIAATSVAVLAGSALAQPGPTTSPFGRPPAGPAIAPSASARPTASEVPRSLRARFGLEVAERLLASPQLDARLRGIARASAIGSPEAVALLARAVTHEPRADARATLDLARALAAFADQAAARAALVAILNAQAMLPPAPRAGATARDGTDETDQAARQLMARQVAALALAQASIPSTGAVHERQALDALVTAARTAGPGQAAALHALVVHPPSRIELLVHGALSAPLVRVLGELGDLRVLDALRVATRSPDPATRAAALGALGELRDMRAIEAARMLAADPDVRVRIAAADALVSLDAPDRGRVVEALIGQDATALAGARLAERVQPIPNTQTDGVVKALSARVAASGDPVLRAAAIAALGRQPTSDAVQALVLLLDPMLAGEIASALARSPAAAAMPALEGLASRPATRRLAVRAYVVRALVRGERSEALARATSALVASRDPRDRTLGVFASVALGDRPLATALADADPRVRRAGAMAARALAPHVAQPILLSRLAAETDAVTCVLLAPGLLDGDPDGVVTTRALVARLDAGGPDAPLAGLALAARGDETEDSRVAALLASRDAVMRAHVARGLGRSHAHASVGKLAAAYRYEAEPFVRRAVIAALAVRAGDAAPERLATLRAAARLDPDRTVRAIAARGLEGLPPPDPELAPREVALLRITTPDGEGRLPPLMGAVLRADGVAMPIAFDEDGFALAPGTPPGEARVILAPQLASYEGKAP